MKYSSKKRMGIFLAIALKLAAALSLLPAGGLASAVSDSGMTVEVSYLYYEDGAARQGTQRCAQVEAIFGNNTDLTWSASGTGAWYAVTPRAETGMDIELSDPSVETVNVTIDDRVTVEEGVVNLVLCDGASLTVTGGIAIAKGATLNIYAGSLGDTKIDGTGRLYAGDTVSNYSSLGVRIADGSAGIGGSGSINGIGIGIGTLNIHGGTIEAVGGKNAAGIGGGANESGGTVNIYDGTVTAKGGECGAGIGGGASGDHGVASGASLTISGGTVTAKGGNNGAGIGGGSGGHGVASGASLTISGGTVTAIGGPDGTGIGGGAGIGGGSGGVGVIGTLTISGGSVTAIGGPDGTGIGGGSGGVGVASGGKLTISGGTVTATGGVGNSSGGAGIGGGYNRPGVQEGELTIKGGTITATGAGGGAGIGGGKYGCGITGSSAKMEISGGSVIAMGGSDGGAGIGGGSDGVSGGIADKEAEMIISGGNVIAIGGGTNHGGAGIGGGSGNAGGVSDAILTISGGSVTAFGGGTSGSGGAGIGGGMNGTGLNVAISGSSTVVTATGGSGGAGIGSGYAPNVDNAVTVTISGGSVTAFGCGTSGSGGAGIGGGADVTISGSATVIAVGNGGAKGIGSGGSNDSGRLKVKGTYYYFKGNGPNKENYINNGPIQFEGSEFGTADKDSYIVFEPELHTHEGIDFFPWAETTSLPQEGNYYLVGNVRLTENHTIKNSKTLNLDLNGKTVFGPERSDSNKEGSAFVINSTGVLNLYDAGSAGKITHVSTKEGRGVTVNGGTFNMNGGAIAGNILTTDGGAGVYVDSGAVNMHGGAITGNQTKNKNGAGVYVANGASFQMDGGSVTGNSLITTDNPYYGAGVYVAGNGTFTLLGSGKVDKNELRDSNTGVTIPSNVYPNNAALDAVRYVKYTADGNGNPTAEVMTTSNYTVLDAFNTTNAEARKWSSGDYVLLNDVDTDIDGGSIVISGPGQVVNLILCDGATLCANSSIQVERCATLNIYIGSTTETTTEGILATGGKLYATKHDAPASPFNLYPGNGITVAEGSTLTIHGGTVEAKGRIGQAGIGGGAGEKGGTVTIYDGAVTAMGGRANRVKAIGPGSGIGGGGSNITSTGGGGSVNIYGGTVVAIGGSGLYEIGPGGAGIGGGGGTYGADRNSNATTVNGLYGGNGGTVKIYGGTVNATGINGGAGIGGGAGGKGGIQPLAIDSCWATGSGGKGGDGGDVSIYGGSVSATSCDTGGDLNLQNVFFLMKGIDSEERHARAGHTNAADSKRVGIGGGAGGAHTHYNLKNVKNQAQSGTDGTDGGNGTLSVGPNVAVRVKGEETGSEWQTLAAADFTGGGFDVSRDYHYFKAHENVRNYSAEGPTITASCRNKDYWYIGEPILVWPDRNASFSWVNKDNESEWRASAKTWHDDVTLTLIKPTLTVYGGTGSPMATLDAEELAVFNAATSMNISANDIRYVGRESTTYSESATAPTESGTYTAKLRLSSDSDIVAKLDYEIGKIDAVAATVSANDRIYDETEKPLVTVTGAATGGEMQYAIGTATEATQPYTTSIPTATNAGTYYVWYKVKGDANHTDTEAASVTSTICGAISQTVTFKVVNGSWDDETTADKTVTLTGYEGDTLKLAVNQIPAVGGKPNDTYKAGSWDVTPSTDTAITAATTYTYTYAQKEAATVTKTPTAKSLTYNGQAQALVTAGEAEGGTMQYALGTKDKATQPYTTSIPTGIDSGTYYVWYKVKGDANHTDTKPDCIKALIINLYFYISGDGSTWTKSTGLSLIFQITNSVDDSKAFSNFSGAKVDGKQLTRDKEYTASRGSVIIELKPTYLETLSVGEHTLTAEFTDGKADAKFTVAKGEPINLPQTGDSSNVLIYALIGILAIAGIGLTIKKQ